VLQLFGDEIEFAHGKFYDTAIGGRHGASSDAGNCIGLFNIPLRNLK
jgi:hypothetical protein